MVKLSATILAYNEEKRIGACLESLCGVADEIIVVDSYSTDRTVEICVQYGCRITRRLFDGFGAQRQYATSGFSHRVYNVSRLNFYCGMPVKHCGWYPDLQIRLFDKRYANWNLRDVAEKVIFRDSVKPELIDGDILHYRCDTKEQYADVSRRHAAMKARVLAVNKEKIGPLSPFMHGMKAFWHTYITEGGILEGSVGREIAAAHYRSELLAYSAAKALSKKK